MAKPCDTKEYRDKLPCLSPDGKTCYGRQYWDRAPWAGSKGDSPHGRVPLD